MRSSISNFLYSLFIFINTFFYINAVEDDLSSEIDKIMNLPKYAHATWGLYVKDTRTGKVHFDLNADKLFSPASTTKLFSVAALLDAYGIDYRFKTPVYASNKIQDGILKGDLILVGQGDLTFGGRQSSPDKISFTKLDHINANEIPGVILTKESPLYGINEIVKQIASKGIREIQGDIIIDDQLFETIEKRGMVLSPIMINENLIDITIKPSEIGRQAQLTWRPIIQGYSFVHQITTVAKGEPTQIEITNDDLGRQIILRGTISMDDANIVRTFPIKDPKFFARAAFTQSLQQQGIKVNLIERTEKLPENWKNEYEQIALFTSPPLSEYAALILKVSHNVGADLVPLLLASKENKRTFDEGMRLLGDFVTSKVKLSTDDFVFIDAAGGNENRLSPKGEVQLLEFLANQPKDKFQHFYDALPILGKDGSLEDFGREAQGAGKIRAKTGTGVAFNLATGKLFLITQALGGYIEREFWIRQHIKIVLCCS